MILEYFFLILHNYIISIGTVPKGRCGAGSLYDGRVIRRRLWCLTVKKSARAEEVRAYIDEHCTDPINCDSIARTFGISTSKLRELFIIHVNMTPSDYLKEVRLYRLERMVIDSPDDIKHVSLAAGIGYATASGLATLIKRRMHMTVAEYVSSVKNNGFREGNP